VPFAVRPTMGQTASLRVERGTVPFAVRPTMGQTASLRVERRRLLQFENRGRRRELRTKDEHVSLGDHEAVALAGSRHVVGLADVHE